MKKLASLIIAGLVLSTSSFATKYTLSNGNFGSQTSSLTFADGDILEIPSGANVPFTTTDTIKEHISLRIYGNLKMTPGNKYLVLSSGSTVTIYSGGKLSGKDANQKIIIGSNNVYNGASEVAGGIQPLEANSTSMGFASVSTPLPINLLSFDARIESSTSKVRLSWSAVNDAEEASTFTVEQSTDGIRWNDVVVINAISPAHQTVNYSHELEAPTAAKTVIYRLRYVGADGKDVYSAARSVSLDNSSPAVLVSSSAGNIRVGLTGAPVNTKCSVIVSTMDGKIIYNQQHTYATEAINIPANTPGMYVITITDNSTYRISQKIVMP